MRTLSLLLAPRILFLSVSCLSPAFILYSCLMFFLPSLIVSGFLGLVVSYSSLYPATYSSFIPIDFTASSSLIPYEAVAHNFTLMNFPNNLYHYLMFIYGHSLFFSIFCPTIIFSLNAFFFFTPALYYHYILTFNANVNY
ncbi:hypothetical protein BDZ97DRAFT_1239556 [Flammula alnicola]|nr:hypothetical protein BDZ97DRAFT_1239556 [Flammula alnicola]